MTGARISAVLALLAASPAAADALKVAYTERAPYFYTVDGKPTGIVNEIGLRVLARAGVVGDWAAIPFDRVTADIEANVPVCSIGTFKTGNRVKTGLFTLPIYRNQPLGLLVRAVDAPKLRALGSLKALVAEPSVRVGLIRGASYGTFNPTVDALGERARRYVVPNQRLVRMLAAERFTATPIAPEEFDMLARQAETPVGQLAIITYPDVPPPNLRYFYCAKSVGEAMIARLDAAIRVELPDLAED